MFNDAISAAWSFKNGVKADFFADVMELLDDVSAGARHAIASCATAPDELRGGGARRTRWARATIDAGWWWWYVCGVGGWVGVIRAVGAWCARMGVRRRRHVRMAAISAAAARAALCEHFSLL